jgi:hypothetical protein
MQWFGKPVVFNRFLGQVDQDDPTNLPIGLAALCRNTDFTRESPGVTCASTRAGINLAMQTSVQAQITGAGFFQYEPELATETFFDMPYVFDAAGNLWREYPVGTGRMVKIPATPLFSPPLKSHMIGCNAENKVWQAFSDLNVPTGPGLCFDPKQIQNNTGKPPLNPIGMKPVGWYWQPNTDCLAMEVCCPSTPSTGNGHTYQAQNAGATGPNQPTWPLTTSTPVSPVTVTEVLSAAQIAQGLVPVIWKENTMAMANRLPVPATAVLTVGSGGSFAGGQDVYIAVTFVNNQGETTPSVAAVAVNVSSGASVSVAIPALNTLPNWIANLSASYVPLGMNVYVATVATGNLAPPFSDYKEFNGLFSLGTNAVVTGLGSGSAPPNLTTARVVPGQLPTPDVQVQIQRIPANSTVTPPPAVGLTLVNGAGTIPLGSTLYVVLTLLNSAGETTAGGSSNITTTAANQGVQLDLAQASSYGPTVTGVNAYVAVFASGQSPTNPIIYHLYNTSGPYTPGTTPIIANNVLTGNTPPINNTATLPVGGFPSGRDVYVLQTYTNDNGETKAGPTNSIINTNADDSILVTVAVPEDADNNKLYTIKSVGIYEADVATGTPAPPSTAFALVGYYQPGDTPFILNTAAGQNPPTSNGTGPGGAIVADTETGGANGGQGYRYAALLWMNTNETVSGFTIASVIQYDVDEDGWEIGIFNILSGPSNVVARLIAFTGADASQDGPFNWSGLVNLTSPSQNVVWPTTTLIDDVEQSATAIFDNVTTQANFNFTDTWMDTENNVDDRTDILAPFQACRIDYLKTVNCLAYSGVLGYSGGGLVSIGGDPESVYADTGPVPFPSDGQRCFGFTDAYKSTIFALREKGGYVLTPNTGNASSWQAVQRWSDVGPCGFRAWDANGKFIVFVHRSGLYKYDESDPDMMSKEVPRQWSTINWAAAKNICVTIDEDTHTVRIQVPTGVSTVNNQEFVLSYLEGWNSPIHFSTFSGKEISMDAARRWSFNDVAATLCLRMDRTLPPGPGFIDGPDWTTQPDSSFGVSQIIYGDSSPDGALQARTPGIYSDNGQGIDWEWESVCAGLMQAVCKPEGVNLNALGIGRIYWSFLAARDQDADPGGPKENEIPIGDGYFDLASEQKVGITGKCGPEISEFFRVRFTNGKQPGCWASLKSMTVFLIPFTVGRGEWEG